MEDPGVKGFLRLLAFDSGRLCSCCTEQEGGVEEKEEWRRRNERGGEGAEPEGEETLKKKSGAGGQGVNWDFSSLRNGIICGQTREVTAPARARLS